VAAQVGHQRLERLQRPGAVEVEGRHGLVEIDVLTLERVHLVDVLALLAKRREDARLLTPRVLREEVDQLGAQPSHRGPCAGQDGAAQVAGYLEEAQVLVHQLGDRFDLSAPAVLAHRSLGPSTRRRDEENPVPDARTLNPSAELPLRVRVGSPR